MNPYYQDDWVTLYHGDAYQVLLGLKVVGAHGITDPPYDQRTHANARTLRDGGKESFIHFDPAAPSDVYALLSVCTTRWNIVFCPMESLGLYCEGTGPMWVRAGFWHRPDGTPQISGDRPAQPGEGIAIWHQPHSGHMRWNSGGKRAFYSYGVVRKDRVHETQKPIGLMEELILDFTDPGDLIIDPFAGSGTTGVAAKRLGRRAVLVEQSEQHCASAAYRLGQRTLELQTQGDLF